MSYDRDDDYDDRPRRRNNQSADLTVVDWLLCIFCSGIGCIVGIIRLMSGNPTGGKMIAISLLFAVIWNVLRFALAAMGGK